MLCFVCHTNMPRTGINGQYLEDLMRQHNCAAIWEHPEHADQRTAWLWQMERVTPGDLVFMFANQRSRHGGIIAVGKATGPRQQLLPMQLRPAWYGTEWIVPVEWLTAWNTSDPCPFTALQASFYECDPEQAEVIRVHFNV